MLSRSYVASRARQAKEQEIREEISVEYLGGPEKGQDVLHSKFF